MIKHIIFDFGGVILNFGADAGQGKKTTGIPVDIAKIFSIPLEQAETIWRENKLSLIKGLETPCEFLVKISNQLHVSIDVEQALANWEHGYTLKKESINWDLIDLIKLLKQEYQIHLLSDAINLSRGDEAWVAAIDSLFDHIFRSYEQHTIKPDEEAYTNVLAKIDAQPAECLFIDDVERNITAAEKLGMHGHVFVDTPTFRAHLASLGIPHK